MKQKKKKVRPMERPVTLEEQPYETLVRYRHEGEWIAWDRSMTRDVATGTDMEAVLNEAIKAGEPNPIMEWVPLTSRWPREGE